VLLSAWAVLMTFGVIVVINPVELQRLSQGGQEAEAQACRLYGDNELKKGNVRLAISQYLHSLEIHANQPDVCVNLALAYLKTGNVRLAENALHQAAGLNPTAGLQAMISVHLGEVSEADGHPDEAIRHYEEALSLGARPDLVHQRLGTLYLGMGDLGHALDAFQRVLAEQSDSLRPYQEMLRRTEELAQEDPEAGRWLETAGRSELSQADWNRFDLKSIRQMQAIDPEIAKTHNHLGLILYRLGDRTAAIRHFEQSLAIWPRNTDAVRNLQIIRSESTGSGS
jgi:tetratricopeptide (TPR) repeat protein